MTDQTRRNFRVALYLAIFTIVYNFLEGMVSISFGIAGESLTLFGFGADSLIEVISGIGIMQMVLRIRNQGEEHRNNFEKRALQITGYAFYLLVAGLVITAAYNAYSGHKPETTFWGLVISVISIVVMLLLLNLKM